ncbi:hypothetical protein CPB84DRAFT_1851751 [Gymnopilus junonius]|uniref:Uncharacterized protein n=1 Tax=Gymnopilus junonius TaxID=109634 RepID=A0A9P5NFJ9_GYMJU|nr:hypothetical protein CPB84DRAFT_1851751 [Gymnopilus junonius]
MLLCPWTYMMRVAPLSTPSLCSFCHPSDGNQLQTSTHDVPQNKTRSHPSFSLPSSDASNASGHHHSFHADRGAAYPHHTSPRQSEHIDHRRPPGNITEYAIAQAVTALVEAGEGLQRFSIPFKKEQASSDTPSPLKNSPSRAATAKTSPPPPSASSSAPYLLPQVHQKLNFIASKARPIQMLTDIALPTTAATTSAPWLGGLLPSTGSGTRQLDARNGIWSVLGAVEVYWSVVVL